MCGMPSATKRGDKGWRLAFVLGVAFLITSAAFVWGVSLITGGIALLSAAVTVANGLFSTPANSPAGPKDPLSSAVSRILQVSDALRATTIVAWIVAFALGGYALQQEIRNRYLATIKGLVITANGAPADHAVVTMIVGQTKLTTTTSNGSFVFNDVYVRESSEKNVFVEATLENTVGKTLLDLTSGKHASVVIKLSSYDKRVRVTYYRIGGHGLDFVARGELDARWEKTLSGQPYIVQNETYAYLKSLIGDFSQPFRDTQFYVGPKYTVYEDVAQRNQGRLFFSGAWNHIWPEQVAANDVQSLPDPTSSWNLEFANINAMGNTPFALVPDQPIVIGNQRVQVDPAAFFYWRFSGASELRTLGSSPLAQFYRFITREYVPDDFFLVILQCDIECGDSNSYPSLHKRVIPRDTELLAAVVENISNQPVRIGNAQIKHDPSVRLRDDATESTVLEAARRTEVPLFPPEVLAPGEKILIPLQFRSVYHQQELWPFTNTRQRERNALEADLTGVDAIYLAAYSPRGPQLLRIDRSTFLAFADKPSERDALNKEYVFGPSYELDSIEIDGADTPVRQYKAQNVVIRSGSPMGSCPYAFTYSTSDHDWISEGHILYGVNRPEKERAESIPLHRFDGRVLIRESDAEVSYIDSVAVSVHCEGGEETLYSKDHRLRSRDGNYIMMKQGDELIVEFDEPLSRSCKGPYMLITSGFYLPQ